jgi:hypothetical protein
VHGGTILVSDEIPAKVSVSFWALNPLLSVSKDVEAQTHASPVSFYSVQLVCGAAPHIGCGSASKPILLELERDPLVGEAWLNRSGTMLAVVWKQKVSSRKRTKLVSALLEQEKVQEIKGDARGQALKGFQSGSGWYRGAEVDRLSEEEAEIMASRLVRKMQGLITISDATGRVLEQKFTPSACAKVNERGKR